MPPPKQCWVRRQRCLSGLAARLQDALIQTSFVPPLSDVFVHFATVKTMKSGTAALSLVLDGLDRLDALDAPTRCQGSGWHIETVALTLYYKAS